MTMRELETVLHLAAAAAAILVFMLLFGLRDRTAGKGIVLRAYREFAGMLRERAKDMDLYRRLEKWLCKKGAEFHYGKWVSPAAYTALSLTLGLITAGICMQSFSVIVSLAAGTSMAFVPTVLLLYMNKRDNERQLPELKLIYHALEMQIKAGVYVTDALAECYGSVQEKRLRQALLELAGDIVMKADVFDSLNKLQSKFDNRYVDSLCITILQALESGQAVELLRDVAEQIKDMEESVFAGRKAALDRTITFCQLGVLTVVLGLALYTCVLYMFNAAAFF